MRQLDLREIQLLQLECLCEVDAAFRQLGLRYFLHAGTLLGARRHGGFIPWDDDLDIAVPQPDLAVFAKAWPDLLSDQYSVSLRPTGGLFYKVAIANTQIIERSVALDPNTPSGPLYIDIFPMVSQQSHPWLDPLLRKASYTAMIQRTSLAHARQLGSNQRMKSWALRLLSVLPETLIYELPRRVSESAWSDHSSAIVGEAFASGSGPDHVPYDVIFPLSEINFEGHKFMAPFDIDTYLELKFGDWRREVRSPGHILWAGAEGF